MEEFKPPLNKEKSTSSPTHHHCSSLATPGAAWGLTGTLFSLLQPSPLPAHGLAAEPFSSITSPGSFSPHGLYLSVFVPCLGVPWPCRAPDGAGRQGSSCGLTCAPSPGSSWDCSRRESRRRNLALTDSRHFCVALFQCQSHG